MVTGRDQSRTPRGVPPPNRLERFAQFLALAIVIALLGKCAWFGFKSLPVVTVYGGSVSPDGRWVALIEYVEGPIIAGGIDNAVELRRFDEPLQYFEGERVFLVGLGQDDTILAVRWTGPRSLVVRTLPIDPGRVAIQRREYKGITIAYEALE